MQFTTEADFRQPDRELLHQFEAPPAALVDPIPNQCCNFGDEERVPRSRHPVEVNAPERPPKVTEHTGARYRNPHKVHSRPSALVSHPSLTVPPERLRFFGGRKRERTAVSRVMAGKQSMREIQMSVLPCLDGPQSRERRQNSQIGLSTAMYSL